MILPSLYKKTSTGVIQFWEILVHSYDGCGIISTRFGQLNTPNVQEASEVIYEGKNIGKKNETTAEEQAEKEGKARWEKQLKNGYVTSLEGAKAGEVDVLIEGGIVPMLAHKFAEHAHKIVYPAFVQPKLDGIRCIAILKDGKCTLWSRTRKLITGVPHIARYIERNFGGHVVFDGELYNHEYKNNFEKIVSYVRQDEATEGHEIVQYHVYDTVTDDPFEYRTKLLHSMLSLSSNNGGPLIDVETIMAFSDEMVLEWFRSYRGQGYEGAIVRNAASKYVNKRSYDLQKVKEFEDSEFPIIGIKEGRGKLAGHAIFVCRAENGKEFDVKKDGDTAKLKEYFENHSLWQGKKLTVQYQGLTSAEQVPRFPVGIALRDYE